MEKLFLTLHMLRPGQILEQEDCGQKAYFEKSVFTLMHLATFKNLFLTHEQAKKTEYGQRIRDVEHGVFTSGAMGREATTFYKQLADLKNKTRHIPS